MTKADSLGIAPQSIAAQYAQQWESLAVTPNYISLAYGSGGSGVIYNLYADKLLQTNLINDSVGVSALCLRRWLISRPRFSTYKPAIMKMKCVRGKNDVDIRIPLNFA